MENKMFLRIAKLGLVLIYLVILAGSVVRMTGSGMGCPDWPKCFGRLVPPTDVSQLPANYKEIYKMKYTDLTFNMAHTWTEYINRLIGAVTGLVIFTMMIVSLMYWKTNKTLIALCVLAVFGIGFQAWLGKVVVANELAPVKITIHMMMALVNAALQIWIIVYAQKKDRKPLPIPTLIKWVLGGALLLTMIQVALGTQVRQQIDSIATSFSYQNREIWIALLTGIFKVHRSFSIAILVLNVAAVYLLRKFQVSAIVTSALLALIVLEIATGVVMAYLSIPAYAQPIHLFLASIIFGLQFYLLVGRSRQIVENP